MAGAFSLSVSPPAPVDFSSFGVFPAASVVEFAPPLPLSIEPPDLSWLSAGVGSFFTDDVPCWVWLVELPPLLMDGCEMPPLGANVWLGKPIADGADVVIGIEVGTIGIVVTAASGAPLHGSSGTRITTVRGTRYVYVIGTRFSTQRGIRTVSSTATVLQTWTGICSTCSSLTILHVVTGTFRTCSSAIILQT